MSSTSNYTSEQMTHIAVMKHLLRACDNVLGINNKSVIVIQLFDYITDNAIPLVKRMPRLENVMVEKCYTFKRECPLLLGLVGACERLLTALGKPLQEPSVSDTKRRQDMKRFAAERGLYLTEQVMPAYYNWESQLTERQNRYQKMMTFIQEHKHLFTTTG
jgi:hypothetical protein